MTPEAELSPASTSLPWIASYPPSVDWHMPIPTGPVPDLLDRAARQFPDNPAISFFGRTTSYADLAAEADRVASGLQKIGVKQGTKVGLFLPNTPTFIVYYFAILKAGGTVVNFNPALYIGGIDISGERQRDRDHGHARSRRAVLQDRRAVAARRHRSRHRHSLRQLAASHQVGAVPRIQAQRHCPRLIVTCLVKVDQRSGIIGDHRADEARRNRSGTRTWPCCSIPAAPPVRQRARC